MSDNSYLHSCKYFPILTIIVLSHYQTHSRFYNMIFEIKQIFNCIIPDYEPTIALSLSINLNTIRVVVY